MVSVPVRMYKAARRERIKFRQVYVPDNEPEDEDEEEAEPAPRGRGVVHEFPRSAPMSEAAPPPEPVPETVARVRQNIVAPETEEVVPRASILKGYQTAEDEYVVVKPSEIAALRPKTSSELQILEFVRLAEIDPLYFDTSYFLAPEKNGEKPYALLVKALQQAGDVALGTLAMHGREHAVVIRAGNAGLMLHTLFYANEVRLAEEWKGDVPVAEKELDLAVKLVRAMEEPFDPAKLKDSFEERLRELVESRMPTAAAGGAKTSERESKAPVVDIMEALKRSLAAARKPAERERGNASAKKPTRKHAT